jgi:subtilase family serine protease
MQPFKLHSQGPQQKTKPNVGLAQKHQFFQKLLSKTGPDAFKPVLQKAKPFYTYLNPCATPTATPKAVANSIPSLPPLYYSGAQLLDLYNIPTVAPTTGTRKVVIAVVVAYHYGALLTDLATYWRNAINFGASSTPPTVIVHNLNAMGSNSSTNSINSGWAQEECLDVQMVCTVAPNAEIHVVEANSDTFTDLNAAVTFALGANVNADIVSMSWGANDSTGYSTYSSVYTSNRNVCFCASSGDTNATSWPSVLSNCVSVGGTTLVWTPTLAAPATRTEYTWPSAGCGYSVAVPTPGYQTAVNATPKRAIPDVSLIANPQTSVYVVYAGKWYGFGGTSVSAPIFSAILALANQTRLNAAKPLLTSIWVPSAANTYSVQSRLYGVVNTVNYAQNFYDITVGQDTGTNSANVPTIYAAGVKYDVTTGVGSPNVGALISLLNF